MSVRHVKPNMSKTELLVTHHHLHLGGFFLTFLGKRHLLIYLCLFVWLSLDLWDPATLVEFPAFTCVTVA